MKKGSKPFIFLVLFLIVVYSMIALGYVAIKQDCELLVKERVEKQKVMDLAKNKQINLIAEVQLLSSKERIEGIASEELNMIKRSEPKMLLKVSKEKINEVSEALKEKYE
jgi:cell division protein FtsL